MFRKLNVTLLMCFEPCGKTLQLISTRKKLCLLWKESESTHVANTCLMQHQTDVVMKGYWWSIMSDFKHTDNLWQVPLKCWHSVILPVRSDICWIIKASSHSPSCSSLYIFMISCQCWRYAVTVKSLVVLPQVICHVIQGSFITALSHFQWLYSKSTTRELKGI